MGWSFSTVSLGEHMSRLALFLILIILLPPAYCSSFKPSYDCKRASNETEVAICSDNYLSIQDKQNSQLYKKLLTRKIQDLKQDQINWLKQRNLCKDDRSCIKSSYDKRFSDLNVIERVTSYKENVPGEYRSSYWFWMGHGVYSSPPRKPIEECDDFLKTLNQKKRNTFYTCKIDLQPPFSNLTWQEIPVDSNINLINQLFKLKRKNFYSESRFRNFIKLGEFKVYQATVSGYGEDEDGVYYKIQHECDSKDIKNLKTYEFGGNYFFHKDKNGKIFEVSGIGRPVELFSYKQNLFLYNFTKEISDENLKSLDRTLQVVKLQKLHDGKKFGLQCKYVFTQEKPFPSGYLPKISDY